MKGSKALGTFKLTIYYDEDDDIVTFEKSGSFTSPNKNVKETIYEAFGMLEFCLEYLAKLSVERRNQRKETQNDNP